MLGSGGLEHRQYLPPNSFRGQRKMNTIEIQVSVMGVLTLMLGHELDGQIDKVLTLAEAYDKDGTAFSSR